MRDYGITKTEFTCNNKKVTIITPRKIRSEKQKIKLTKKYNNELKLLEEKILKINDKITVEVSSLSNEKQIPQSRLNWYHYFLNQNLYE